jgi:hypothetical protein
MSMGVQTEPQASSACANSCCHLSGNRVYGRVGIQSYNKLNLGTSNTVSLHFLINGCPFLHSIAGMPPYQGTTPNTNSHTRKQGRKVFALRYHRLKQDVPACVGCYSKHGHSLRNKFNTYVLMRKLFKFCPF